MSCDSRKDRECGDNYGDIECPFCDKVFRHEGETFKLGDRCKFCNAEVTGLGPYGYDPDDI